MIATASACAILIVMNWDRTLVMGTRRVDDPRRKPRILVRGDLMQAELMPMCGQTAKPGADDIALDPLDHTNQKCERIARCILRPVQGHEARDQVYGSGWPPWRSR